MTRMMTTNTKRAGLAGPSLLAAMLFWVAGTCLVSAESAPTPAAAPASKVAAEFARATDSAVGQVDALTTSTVHDNPGKGRVIFRWRTETESNSFGTFVYRADSPDGEMRCLNPENPLHGAGTTTRPQNYVYFDLQVVPGRTYYYKIKSVDLDGSYGWMVGGDKPVVGKAKVLTEAEREELRTKGSAYRE